MDKIRESIQEWKIDTHESFIEIEARFRIMPALEADEFRRLMIVLHSTLQTKSARNTHTIDKYLPDGVRVTEDQVTLERNAIRKVTIHQKLFTMEGMQIALTHSTETPVAKWTDEDPLMERSKRRVSFYTQSGAIIDLTQMTRSQDGTVAFEVEVELHAASIDAFVECVFEVARQVALIRKK